ncbi:MFS transporter [Roseomonas rosulenta]|uniref:MFS transporter n=1 Tax=Roseomonas rosulenta TaxID=2748667 RepID=UPI0018E029B1|nr:MFS transporter [Roseomonas rosulenta]
MLAAALAPRLARHGIHYGWVMVALTFLVSICTSAAVSLPGVLILPMSRDLGWGRGEVSGAMGLMFLLFAVTAPFAGALLLRYGLRRMVVTGTGLATLCVLGVTRATEPWHVWVAFGVLGLAAGMLALVLSATVVNRWFAERRGLAMGILTAAFAAGQLSFLPAAAALAEVQGWRMAVLPAVAGLGVCSLLYVLFARDWPADLGLAPFGAAAVVRPTTPPKGNAVAISLNLLAEASATRAFWILAGTFFVCGLSSTGIVSQHFIPFCADNGVGAVTAASYLALMGVFNFLGTVGSGWLSDRVDNRTLLACYYVLRGLSLVWLPFGSFDMFTLTLWAVFFGLDFVATVPPTVRLTAQHFGPEKAAVVFGWIFAAHQLGSATSALFAGIWRDAVATYLPAFVTVGLVSVLAGAVVLALRQAQPASPRPA